MGLAGAIIKIKKRDVRKKNKKIFKALLILQKIEKNSLFFLLLFFFFYFRY